MSQTLRAIVDKLLIDLPTDKVTELDLPFDIEAFCRENDEKLQRYEDVLSQAISLLYQGEALDHWPDEGMPLHVSKAEAELRFDLINEAEKLGATRYHEETMKALGVFDE